MAGLRGTRRATLATVPTEVDLTRMTFPPVFTVTVATGRIAVTPVGTKAPARFPPEGPPAPDVVTDITPESTPSRVPDACKSTDKF